MKGRPFIIQVCDEEEIAVLEKLTLGKMDTSEAFLALAEREFHLSDRGENSKVAGVGRLYQF